MLLCGHLQVGFLSSDEEEGRLVEEEDQEVEVGDRQPQILTQQLLLKVRSYH